MLKGKNKQVVGEPEEVEEQDEEKQLEGMFQESIPPIPQEEEGEPIGDRLDKLERLNGTQIKLFKQFSERLSRVEENFRLLYEENKR